MAAYRQCYSGRFGDALGPGSSMCASCEDIFPGPASGQPVNVNPIISVNAPGTAGACESRWWLWLAIGFGFGYLVND